jgi:hypothetical protein
LQREPLFGSSFPMRQRVIERKAGHRERKYRTLARHHEMLSKLTF